MACPTRTATASLEDGTSVPETATQEGVNTAYPTSFEEAIWLIFDTELALLPCPGDPLTVFGI